MYSEKEEILEAFDKILQALDDYRDRLDLAGNNDDYRDSIRQVLESNWDCEHELIDISNSVVNSGYMCNKCGTVFKAHQIQTV